MGEHRISALVLNYESPPDMLAACIDSLLASERVDLHEILLLDNGSVVHAEAPAAVAAERTPRVRLVRLGANHGFSGGINRGVGAAHPSCDLVFLLNTDAVVAPDALAECEAAMVRAADYRCVAVAPKMLLAADPAILDAVGNCVRPNGEAANIGLGQPDLGQFDDPPVGLPRDVFGACFGAALVRRAAFSPEMVGPLDERFFLYYEDVDWNWRAQLLGYRTVVATTARVTHLMSASTRELPYGFKFRFAERNLLLCAMKNTQGRNAYKIWLRRTPAYLRGALNGHYRADSLRVVGGVLRNGPHAWFARIALRHRRVRSDAEIFRYSEGQRSFYDPVAYAPIRSWDALRFAADLAQEPDIAAAAARHDPQGCISAAGAMKPRLRANLVSYLAQLGTTATVTR